MHCDCCDVLLTPQESVRRFRDSGEFTNTCTRCLRDIPIPTVEGRNYKDDDDIDDDDYKLPFDDDDLDEI